MGLGGFPASDKQFLGMLGMHGTYEANLAMQNCDVLLAVGARFDDRVIGNPKHFAQNPRKIVHVDIDPSSISKRVKVDVPIVGDVRECLLELTAQLREAMAEGGKLNKALPAWWKQIDGWREKDCLKYDRAATEVIKPQFVTTTVPEVFAVQTYHRSLLMVPQPAKPWPSLPVVLEVVSNVNGPAPLITVAELQPSLVGGGGTTSTAKLPMPPVCVL